MMLISVSTHGIIDALRVVVITDFRYGNLPLYIIIPRTPDDEIRSNLDCITVFVPAWDQIKGDTKLFYPPLLCFDSGFAPTSVTEYFLPRRWARKCDGFSSECRILHVGEIVRRATRHWSREGNADSSACPDCLQYRSPRHIGCLAHSIIRHLRVTGACRRISRAGRQKVFSEQHFSHGAV